MCRFSLVLSAGIFALLSLIFFAPTEAASSLASNCRHYISPIPLARELGQIASRPEGFRPLAQASRLPEGPQIDLREIRRLLSYQR